MATYTRDELRNAVLQELGVLDAVEAPEAEDAVLADSRCQQQLELLNDDGLIPFDLDGAVPARYFIPLVQVIAYQLILPYGQLGRAELLAANHERGMRSLRRLKAKPYYGNPAPAVYY